jgi:hypothetical protein
MKIKIPVFAALLGLFTLLPVSSYAQSVRLTARVPFAFVVGNHTMPAGEYTVQKTEAMRGAWKISGPRDPAGSFIIARPGATKPAAKPRLVFHRYGERYLLSQIWTGGSDRILELPQSRMERDLVKRKSNRPGVISIAMR